MNCPYCEKEMFRGSINSIRAPVYWYPEGEWGGVWKNDYIVDITSKIDLDRTEKAETFYCYDCAKMIVDVAAAKPREVRIEQYKKERREYEKERRERGEEGFKKPKLFY